jgi:two-component system, cell cycle sensor histidine kinase and response regulator CckA
MSSDHSAAAKLQAVLAPPSVADDVFRLFAQHTRDIFWVSDPSGEKILYVSPAYEEVFGRTRESLYRDAMSWLAAVPVDERERVWREIESGIANPREREMEYRIIRPDGSIRCMVDRAFPFRNAEGKVEALVGVVEDITQRKNAEEKLKISEEKFSKAFQYSPDAITLCTLANGRFIEANDSFLRLTGFTREEVTGRTAPELGIWPYPKQRDQFVALLKRDGKVRDIELRLARKSGEVRTILASAHIVEVDGAQCAISILRDITDRKALEEQLRQAQKMEAVGRLAGGVAHDFNNLLVGILGYSELLNKKLPDESSLKRMAGEIYAAALRARDLTSRLLALSRRQVLQPKVLDFNAVVRQAGRLLEPSIGEDIRIEFHLDSKLGFVKADPAQLEQMVLNLALNARDAMPHGGKMSLETSNAQVDAAVARQHPGLIPGSYVRLRVADTGRGIRPEDMPRIFEPFFTTKDLGEGAGLGLSTVYGIVKQSGGCVTVTSEPGHGAVFEVYLPRVNETPGAQTPAAEPIALRAGTETILVVEDEPVVRSFARDLLEEAGYRIFFASDGAEAIRQAVQIDEPIHLLITDVVMPEMSGPELASRLRKLRPQSRVLYMSGYTDDEVLCRKGLPENSAFIQKPFTPEQFSRKVRETLDAKPKPGQ